MRARRQVAWVLVVSALLVIVLGAVASGRLAGQKAIGAAAPYLGGGGGENYTIHRLSSLESTPSSPQTTYGGAVQQNFSPRSFNLPPLAWLLYLAVIVVLGLGLAMVLRGGTQADVYDFKAALDELKHQKSLVDMKWSYRLRNAALLRYYAIMCRICAKMGVEEYPSETPAEYIQKASERLGIAQTEASRFASAFNRARYGLELSELETKEAAEFMESFVDGMSGRFGIG